MNRILVVQLARLGDILMTGPLLRGLRRDHPSAEISLMVMDAFADAPLPAHLYDRLLSFPLQGVTRTLVERRPDWTPALAQLRTFINDVSPHPFDLAINLDQTETSALVMALVPASKRSGLFLRSNRSRAIAGPWITYLRAAAKSRDYTAFHLVDLFAWAGGVARDAAGLEVAIAETDREWASTFLAAHGISEGPFIAMMLGASCESKRWPPERFADLADALDPALGAIVLVGGPGERALAAACRAATDRPIVDATGHTTPGQLAALLARSRILVTNDTGPMHVATAAGTRVVDLSSGPVSAHETGPYGEGHLVIEPTLSCFPCPFGSSCHQYECRTALTPADAAAVVRYALGAGDVPTLNGSRLLRGARTSGTGRQSFEPLGTPLTTADVVRKAAAAVWEASLDAPRRVGGGWNESAADADACEPGPAGAPPAEAAQHALRDVAGIARTASAALKQVPRSSPARCQSISNDVHAHLQQLLSLAESERATHALVTHLRHEIESVAPGDPMTVARMQAAAYGAAAIRAAQLADALATCPAVSSAR